jgi:hypothetical protein
MEYFKELTLDLAQHKPSLWFHYFHDTFTVWPHELEWLQNFLSDLNDLSPSIQFKMEIEPYY